MSKYTWFVLIIKTNQVFLFLNPVNRMKWFWILPHTVTKNLPGEKEENRNLIQDSCIQYTVYISKVVNLKGEWFFMTVPDNMEGAIVLSLVDFFLSIVIIWGISWILYLFPYLNKLGKIDEDRLKSGH